MGHPVTIQDDGIEVDKPSSISNIQYHEDFGDHEYLIAITQLAKLAGRMTTSMYGRRMQRCSFSQRVQHSLKELTSWVEHLPDHLQIEVDSTSVMAPEAIISMHLLFNQCVILATRPVLLHALRTHTEVSSMTTESPGHRVPQTVSALAEVCIRCARHSQRLLVRAWTSGSFFMFDYFHTQYLFSAITILAISDFLRVNDGQTNGEDFEIGTELLGELKQNGNFAAIEFCRHTDAMRLSQAQFLQKIGDTAVDGRDLRTGPSSTAVPTDNIDSPLLVTAGMGLTEPSFQIFLAQPDLDSSFMYNDGLQDNFLPGFGSEYWMTG